MSLSKECCTPGPDINHAASGHDEQLAGIDCYVVGTGRQAVVIACDIFGHTYEHLRKNADFIASQGFTVIVPDQFAGNAVTKSQMEERGSKWLFDEWFPQNPLSLATDRIRIVVEAIKGKYDTIHGNGYCYGAYPIWHLSAEGLLKTGVLSHPTGLTKVDPQNFKVPTLFNCAERDHIFTPEIRQAFETALKDKDAKFIEYADTDHGFVARGDDRIQPQRRAAMEATVNWFKSHA